MGPPRKEQSSRPGPRSRTRPTASQDASQLDMSPLEDEIDGISALTGAASSSAAPVASQRSQHSVPSIMASQNTQEAPLTGPNGEEESVAKNARRRLEEARRLRTSLDLPPSDTQRSTRAQTVQSQGDNYMRSRERIQKFRHTRMDLDSLVEKATMDEETQHHVSDTLQTMVEAEAAHCTTAEEFMEMQRTLDVGSRVIQGVFQNVMSMYGSIKPMDVVKAAAEDPRRALITIKMARKKMKEQLGTMKMVGGRHLNAGPGRLNLGGQNGTVEAKKERAARQKKQEKTTVVPERATEDGERNKDDATSLGVRAMHDKLRAHKKMSLFDLVRDQGNDFQKTALNTHILAILLDRQLARMVAAEPGTCRAKDAVQVYYVANKAAQNDANARKKLAEDVEHGHTWITRWDNGFLTVLREATDDTVGFDDSYAVFDDDEVNGASGGGGGSVNSQPPAAKQARR